MRYATVCSGIAAESVAWAPLGWKPVWFCENAKAPSAVLAHHHPDVPNMGDLLDVAACPPPSAFDLLLGGTPCQGFSVAGHQRGMDDPRSSLAGKFLELVQRKRPTWVVWENVPGALGTNGGRDFQAFTDALTQCGYGWAWRILDAQHFGVPQRRRRIFLVGHSGGRWQPAAAVLFEREGLFGDPLAGRAPGPDLAAPAGAGAGEAGGGISCTLTTRPGARFDGEGLVVAYDATQITSPHNHSNPKPGLCHTLTVKSGAPIAFDGRQDPTAASVAPTMAAFCGSYGVLDDPLAFDGRQTPYLGNTAPCLTTEHDSTCTLQGGRVRRFTPLECERLQGFPDGHTAVPYGKGGRILADTPRYACLGNSIAVPVLAWLGRRIEAVDAITKALVPVGAEHLNEGGALQVPLPREVTDAA